MVDYSYSREYAAAYAAHAAAFDVFDAVRTNYRARLVGDAEFLAARAAYAASTALFDAAYAAEVEREVVEEAAEEAARPAQGELF